MVATAAGFGGFSLYGGEHPYSAEVTQGTQLRRYAAAADTRTAFSLTKPARA
jgi:hypothetical protein